MSWWKRRRPICVECAYHENKWADTDVCAHRDHIDPVTGNLERCIYFNGKGQCKKFRPKEGTV
jgi:hypothetical protein